VLCFRLALTQTNKELWDVVLGQESMLAHVTMLVGIRPLVLTYDAQMLKDSMKEFVVDGRVEITLVRVAPSKLVVYVDDADQFVHCPFKKRRVGGKKDSAWHDQIPTDVREQYRLFTATDATRRRWTDAPFDFRTSAGRRDWRLFCQHPKDHEESIIWRGMKLSAQSVSMMTRPVQCDGCQVTTTTIAARIRHWERVKLEQETSGSELETSQESKWRCSQCAKHQELDACIRCERTMRADHFLDGGWYPQFEYRTPYDPSTSPTTRLWRCDDCVRDFG